jgi:hypothetical protein
MATTPNFNWATPDNTGLVRNGALDIRTLGDAIDASLVDLKGGTTGQVLSKASNTDMDFTWVTDAAGDITGVTAGTGISGGGTSGTVTVTNSMATAIDAKGDLIGGTGADTFARLAVGANGTVLTADSAEATGLKWAVAAAGGGKLLQVVRDTDTSLRSTTSTSFTDVTGVSVTITPTSATSNIMLILAANLQSDGGTLTTFFQITDSSNNAISGAESSEFGFPNQLAPATLIGWASPATTSAVTYKMRFKTAGAATTAYVRGDFSTTQLFALEIGA